jgi:hypothetical protein
MPSRVDTAKSENAIPVHILYRRDADLSKITDNNTDAIASPQQVPAVLRRLLIGFTGMTYFYPFL